MSVLPGDAKVGQQLIGHRGVDKVSFTGSTAAGKAVAAACAADLKRVSLELGGKSAAVVLDDADPSRRRDCRPVGEPVQLRPDLQCAYPNSVAEPPNDEFVDALAAEMTALRIGDPCDPETQLGPLVSKRQQHRVRDYIPRASGRAPALSSAAPTCPTVSSRAGT